MTMTIRTKNYRVHNNEWRGLLKFNTFGRGAYTSFDDLVNKVFHPYYVLFFVLIGALHALFDVGEFKTHKQYWVHISSTSAYLAVVFVVVNVLEAASIYISKRFKRFFIYTPLNIIVAVAIANFLTAFASNWLPGNAITTGMALFHLPIQMALAIIFQATYDLFVLPAIRDSQNLHKLEAEQGDLTVSIGGKKFVANDLYSLSANDHYLEVKTVTKSHFLRSRLADAVLQLEQVDGIMPHRSHWVARFAIDQLNTSQTPKVLKMTDGSEIPVANARVSEVNDWL